MERILLPSKHRSPHQDGGSADAVQRVLMSSPVFVKMPVCATFIRSLLAQGVGRRQVFELRAFFYAYRPFQSIPFAQEI